MPRLVVTPMATAADRAAALEVWAEARRAVFRAPAQSRRDRVASKLQEAPVALLARYGDRVAGMTLAEDYCPEGALDASTGHVSMLFVDPAYWGNGIGAALVRALQAPPAGTGWTALSVWTRADNTRGRRLYAGRGFLETGETSSLHEGEQIIRLGWSR